MNQIYGFEGEVKAKYTAQMYELFSEVFEWLPLAQCINGKVLVRAAARPRRPLRLPRPPGAACGHVLRKQVGELGCGPRLHSYSCPLLRTPDHARRLVQ